jgi:hypothetical protein
MSTTEKNKLLIRRYSEEIVNAGNVDDVAGRVEYQPPFEGV